MLTSTCLWLASLMVPSQASQHEIVRIKIAQHIGTMIGYKKDLFGSTLPDEYLKVPPRRFCRMILNDYRTALFKQLKQYDVTYAQLQEMCKAYKKSIISRDHNRRLERSEKPAHATVKRIIHELSTDWNISHSLRIINSPEGSGLGAARISEIFFDEEWWENEHDNDLSILKFIAGHELTHALFEDIAWDEALNEVQNELHSKRKARAFSALKACISKLFETQADTESALHSKNALRGYLLWTSNDLMASGNSGGKSHPLMSYRAHLARLLKQLNETYEPQSRKKRKIE